MADPLSLDRLTGDIADAVQAIDSETTGQYGDGLGSENEERQLDCCSTISRRQTTATRKSAARCRISISAESEI